MTFISDILATLFSVLPLTFISKYAPLTSGNSYLSNPAVVPLLFPENTVIHLLRLSSPADTVNHFGVSLPYPRQYQHWILPFLNPRKVGLIQADVFYYQNPAGPPDYTLMVLGVKLDGKSHAVIWTNISEDLPRGLISIVEAMEEMASK